jgi:hypothetical protein
VTDVRGRSTTRRPLKRAFSQTSHEVGVSHFAEGNVAIEPFTLTQDAGWLKFKAGHSSIVLSELKERIWNARFS